MYMVQTWLLKNVYTRSINDKQYYGKNLVSKQCIWNKPSYGTYGHYVYGTNLVYH